VNGERKQTEEDRQKARSPEAKRSQGENTFGLNEPDCNNGIISRSYSSSGGKKM
jgi:hypothetical protein